jgi:hypothetical protein
MEIDIMPDELVFVFEESPEGGYEAHALGHSIYTYANSLDELRVMVEDAVNCHFDETERPAQVKLEQL